MIGSPRELELEHEISTIVPDPLKRRYARLNARRRAEKITDGEYSELLELTEAIESLNADRVTLMAELAQLRCVDLSEVAKEFSGKRDRG